jgi:hypothetical protein
MINGTNQEESSITTPNDIHLEEKITDTNLSDNEHSVPDLQNTSEDIPISIDENPQ